MTCGDDLLEIFCIQLKIITHDNGIHCNSCLPVWL